MAVDMFFRIGDIKGESMDFDHTDEIDVIEWNWGMTQSGSMHVGGGGGSGKVNVQDLTFTKWVDRSTPNLMLKCCMGEHYPDAVLTMRKSGQFPIEYVVLTLRDVLISAINTGSSGGEDRLTETVTLNFAEFKFTYQPQKKDGSPDGGPVEAIFNILANK